jgi:hypothetical protein
MMVDAAILRPSGVKASPPERRPRRSPSKLLTPARKAIFPTEHRPAEPLPYRCDSTSRLSTGRKRLIARGFSRTSLPPTARRKAAHRLGRPCPSTGRSGSASDQTSVGLVGQVIGGVGPRNRAPPC